MQFETSWRSCDTTLMHNRVLYGLNEQPGMAVNWTQLAEQCLTWHNLNVNEIRGICMHTDKKCVCCTTLNIYDIVITYAAIYGLCHLACCVVITYLDNCRIFHRFGVKTDIFWTDRVNGMPLDDPTPWIRWEGIRMGGRGVILLYECWIVEIKSIWKFTISNTYHKYTEQY